MPLIRLGSFASKHRPTPGGGTTYNVPGTVNNAGTTDATSGLSTWIASVPDGTVNNPSILKFNGGTYRIDTQLHLTSRSYLTFDLNNNTTIQWNTANNDALRLLWFTTSTGIVIKNGTLLGTYTYPASGDAHNTTFQHMHGVCVDRSNVTVSGMSISGFYGDGVDFTNESGGTAVSSGSVVGCDIRKVGRNGVSVVAGDGVTIGSGTHIQQTGFWGIDLEPNDGQTYVCKNVTIDGVTWGGQVGTTQRRVFGINSSSTVPVTDVIFRNNATVGRDFDIQFNPSGTQGTRIARVTMSNNTSDTASFNEIWTLKQIDGLTVSGNTIPTTGGNVVLGLYNATDYNIVGSTYAVH